MNILEGKLSGGAQPEVRGEGFCLSLHGRMAAAAEAQRSAMITAALQPERLTVDGTGGTEASVSAYIQHSVEEAEGIGSCQFRAARIQNAPTAASLEVGLVSPPLVSGE